MSIQLIDTPILTVIRVIEPKTLIPLFVVVDKKGPPYTGSYVQSVLPENAQIFAAIYNGSREFMIEVEDLLVQFQYDPIVIKVINSLYGKFDQEAIKINETKIPDIPYDSLPEAKPPTK